MSYDPSAPDDTPEHSPSDEALTAERPTPVDRGDGEAAAPLIDGGRQSSVDARYAPAPFDADGLPSRETAPLSGATDASDFDDYGDIPASLELAYTASDLGLSPGAYERAIPYGDVARRRPSHSGMRARRIGRELVETVILALLIFFAVKAVVQNFRVEGSSMEPSLHTEQYLLVNKALYFRVNMDKVHDVLPFISGDNGEKRHLFRAPRRGDVIVFKYPGDPSRDFIKRVIGVPGDTVEVHDGTVFVNGSPLAENYIKERPNYTYAPKTVPPNSYWVLGDNRNNSFDSHAWASSCTAFQQCDFVPEENIIGQAWVSYWPFDSVGFVNNKIVKPSAP